MHWMIKVILLYILLIIAIRITAVIIAGIRELRIKIMFWRIREKPEK